MMQIGVLKWMDWIDLDWIVNGWITVIVRSLQLLKEKSLP
jgi:hypothetical protein